MVAIGVAVVNPKDRQFKRRVGAVKALGRAKSDHPFIEVVRMNHSIRETVGFYAASLASMGERQFVHEVGKIYGRNMTRCEENIHHNNFQNQLILE